MGNEVGKEKITTEEVISTNSENIIEHNHTEPKEHEQHCDEDASLPPVESKVSEEQTEKIEESFYPNITEEYKLITQGIGGFHFQAPSDFNYSSSYYNEVGNMEQYSFDYSAPSPFQASVPPASTETTERVMHQIEPDFETEALSLLQEAVVPVKVFGQIQSDFVLYSPKTISKIIEVLLHYCGGKDERAFYSLKTLVVMLEKTEASVCSKFISVTVEQMKSADLESFINHTDCEIQNLALKFIGLVHEKFASQKMRVSDYISNADTVHFVETRICKSQETVQQNQRIQIPKILEPSTTASNIPPDFKMLIWVDNNHKNNKQILEILKTKTKVNLLLFSSHYSMKEYILTHQSDLVKLNHNQLRIITNKRKKEDAGGVNESTASNTNAGVDTLNWIRTETQVNCPIMIYCGNKKDIEHVHDPSKLIYVSNDPNEALKFAKMQ